MHPWDKINIYWEGTPKYDLDNDNANEYINKIIRVPFLKYNNEILIDKHYLTDLNIIIFIERL